MEKMEWYQNYSGYWKSCIESSPGEKFLDDLTAFILQRDWITCCWLKFFFFVFALHGGNEPPDSCESGCRPASVSRMNWEWCYCLWTKAKCFVMNSVLPATTKVLTLFMKALHKKHWFCFVYVVYLCVYSFF